MPDNVPTVNLPLGALKLGCRNCRVGDRARFPELGLVYCSVCPVTRRCEDGGSWVIAGGHALAELQAREAA